MKREMKDSGIPWIGMIPEDWEICKVKHHYRFVTGFTPSSKNDKYYDENGIPWVTISELDGNKYITKSKKGISHKFVEIFHPEFVSQGSLLYSFKLSVGQVAITKINLYTNEAIAAFLPEDNICLEFLFYSSQFFIEKNANENIYGAKLLNQELIKNAIIIFPPLPTQQRIANFLDRKCAEIDELAALQETMIAELKKYKQSVITEAVTKGLIKNVPMKDSGVEWIGEIPSHWVKCTVKQIMRNKSLKGYPNEQVLSLYRDWGVVPKDSRDDNHNVTSEDTASYKLVDVGDFVINKMKAWQGSMAVSNYHGIISPAYYICSFVNANIFRKYFHYLLRNETYKVEYRRLSTGLRIGQWDLNIDDFLHIPIVFPPLSEQQAIADYLDPKCEEIDELITIKQQKLEALKDFKKSFIFEYVTGKKEVME